MTTALTTPVRQEFAWLTQQARAPRLRTLRRFAEEEIVIPDGPYAGRRFRCDRQPWTGLWFDAVDSGRWRRAFATGPTQTGKTLSGFVITAIYHLFEIGETVICGVPKIDMIADKWHEDIRPVIEASRYRDQLPRRGRGSQGGTPSRIQFRDGQTLRFMTGGGDDKTRAGFTGRVVVITEVDGLDESGGTSREADKVTQLEARTRAFGDRARIYGECTVTTEDGRTWQEFSGGTASRIILPCPHCGDWVSPERGDLHGWRAAADKPEAQAAGHFACPNCGKAWTEDERTEANRAGRLVHRGQEVAPDGRIVGDPARTDTLGFRWSAVNNLFAGAGVVAADEWRSERATDRENAKKEMCQFVWCNPYDPPAMDLSRLDPHGICQRTTNTPRGVVPVGTKFFTVFADIGQYICHWIALAIGEGFRVHVVDYARLEVPYRELGLERGVLAALREFRDQMCVPGWMDVDGKRRSPDQVWIDAGWQGERDELDFVYSFCTESNDGDDAHGVYRPTLGRGTGLHGFRQPAKRTAEVPFVGDNYYISRASRDRRRVWRVVMNADYWKTFVHARLTTPAEHPGAMTLFAGEAYTHLDLARHLTAEKKIEDFVPSKGVVVRWEKVHRQNHWFDAAYGACVAAHFCGARLEGIETPRRPKARRRRTVGGLTMPDGRPFLMTQR